MTGYFFPAIFHPEDKGYSVTVPDIDGCITQGDDLNEAYEMAIDAIGLCLEDAKEIPQPSTIESLSPSGGDIIVLVEFDMIKYLKKHDTRSVKKTLTIPSWLNQMAEQKHLNFSSILQEGLKQHLGV